MGYYNPYYATEGVDFMGDASRTAELGRVQAGVPLALDLTYVAPDLGEVPLTLGPFVPTDESPPYVREDRDSQYRAYASYRTAVIPFLSTRQREIQVRLEIVPTALALTATPDTLTAGGSATLALTTALPDETAVLLTVSDTDLGTLAGACAAPAARRGEAVLMREGASGGSASFATTVGGLADCRFVADEAGTVTLTAEAGGHIASASVTIEPAALEVRLLRQNDSAVPPPEFDGYVMVSKVRPDWLFPEGSVPHSTPFGPNVFTNTTTSVEGEVFDPDTYRIEVYGYPSEAAAQQAATRIRFEYDVPVPGGLGFGASGNQKQDEVSGTLTGGAVGLDPETATWSVRTDVFLRLVSNGEPSVGAARAKYDDEWLGFQSIPVRLGDTVRFRAERTTDTGPEPIGEIQYRAGDAPSSRSEDAIRRVDLAWQTYRRADGTVLASAPSVATQRASEDWAQAAVYFATASERTFTSASIQNATQIVVTGEPVGNDPTPRTTAPGEIRVRVALPGNPESVVNYGAGASGADIAQLLALDLASKVGRLGVTALGVTDGIDDDESFGVLVVGRVSQVPDGISALSDRDEVFLVPGLPDLDNTRLGSRVAYAATLAVKDEDPGSVDVVVVPVTTINEGEPTGSVPGQTTTTINATAFPDADQVGFPFLSEGRANALLIRPESVNGDDRRFPMTLGHELGHVLIGVRLPAEAGPIVGAHSGLSYNLMSGSVASESENAGGRKRLNESMQTAVRCESGSPADGVPAAECARLGVRYDRAASGGNPALLRVPSSSPLGPSASASPSNR